jgi:hypothetical protein
LIEADEHQTIDAVYQRKAVKRRRVLVGAESRVERRRSLLRNGIPIEQKSAKNDTKELPLEHGRSYLKLTVFEYTVRVNSIPLSSPAAEKGTGVLIAPSETKAWDCAGFERVAGTEARM